MNKFWVVALETYKRNVKSLTFIIMIVAPFLMVGVSVLIGYMGASFDETSKIAVVSPNEMIRESFVSQSSLSVDETIETEKQAKQALEAEEIDGYLVIDTDEVTTTISGEYVGMTALGSTDQLEMSQALSGIQLGLTTQEIGLDQAAVTRLSTPAELKEKTVEFKNGKMMAKKDNKLALTLGAYFISFAMYMIIIMYSQITSQEVASEKGTRIMEIILSSTTAAKHFYGKVMGIFLVIFTQVVIYIGMAVVGFAFAKDLPQVKELLKILSVKDIMTGLLGYNLLYLLFGVLIYTILAALCGSLVSKSEDAGKAAVPVTYLTIIGFLISAMFGMSNPQHIVLKVSSYIPFISSFTMPSRIASGTVTDGGIWLSLTVLVVSTVVLLKVAASMYRSTALVYSDEGMLKVLGRSFEFMKSEKKK